MIASMAMEFTHGKTVGNMKDSGIMESNTEKVFIDKLMELSVEVVGKKASAWNGSTKLTLISEQKHYNR